MGQFLFLFKVILLDLTKLQWGLWFQRAFSGSLLSPFWDCRSCVNRLLFLTNPFCRKLCAFILPPGVRMKHSHRGWDILECQEVAFSHGTCQGHGKFLQKMGQKERVSKANEMRGHNISVQSQTRESVVGGKMPWKLASLLARGRQLDKPLLKNLSKISAAQAGCSWRLFAATWAVRPTTRAIRRILNKKREFEKDGSWEGKRCGEGFQLLGRPSLDGSRVGRRMDTCICMDESLHCSSETSTTLWISCTSTQNVFGVKKKKN